MSSGFFKSFAPLLKRLKKYFLEIILLTVALIITVTALVIYANNNQSPEEEITTSFTPSRDSAKVGQNKIFVDVSGAVRKPNLYQVDFGARLKAVVDKAGGLSDEADTVFFNRNFNLARIVMDQEKIYVPSVVEINGGIFIQSQRTLDYTTPTNNQLPINYDQSLITNNQSLININDATVEELDQLPGIGQVTANKIISNRPYSALEELLTKKVVNKSVWEKIRNMISL